MDKTYNKKGSGELPILEQRQLPGISNSTFGINVPEIFPPAENPPVPNRAWTAMKNGADIEELSEAEKRDLYIGRDNIM